MPVISVRVEKSGRILIPAAIRRQLGIKEGTSELLLNVDETPVAVTTRRQALARARKYFGQFHKPGDDWTADVLAERRDEAGREDQD